MHLTFHRVCLLIFFAALVVLFQNCGNTFAPKTSLIDNASTGGASLSEPPATSEPPASTPPAPTATPAPAATPTPPAATPTPTPPPSVQTLNLKAIDQIGSRAFALAAGEPFVLNVTYEIRASSSALDWSVSSTPANACSLSLAPVASSRLLNCTAAAVVVVSVSQLDSQGRTIGMGTLTADSVTAPSLVPDGQKLYQNRCSSCHNQLSRSTKMDRDAISIGEAILNQSSMSSRSDLKSLNATELREIAAALDSSMTVGP